MKDYKALQNGSDIRGVAMDVEGGKPVNLTNEAAADLVCGFAKWLAEKLGKAETELTIAIGRDSRLTGAALARAIGAELSTMGVRVLVCGLATTPAMFMATKFADYKADGAVMITASHLPLERNGLKFFTAEGGLDKADIKQLIELAEGSCEACCPVRGAEEANADGLICSADSAAAVAILGEIVPCKLMDSYSAHLRNIICGGLNATEGDKPLAGLHIVVDAGNGASGFYTEKVLEPLGADCSGSQFLEPDGLFPNHQPNPENEEAMQSICAAALSASADLGIIFDTDGDRSAAVDEKGQEISRNRIVALAAAIAADGCKASTVVTDSITSTQLGEFLTKELGLSHLRFKRGYKNVINKGIELNEQGIDCRLAIETSGHAAMRENYFLDDGAYLATKIVIKAAMLKKEGKGISSLIQSMKDPLEAKEFRFKVLAEDFSAYAQGVLEHIESSVQSGSIEGWSLELPNYEGVRVNVPGGWFLMRKSLHDPVMPLNIESDEAGGVEKTLADIKELIAAYSEITL